MPSFNQNPKAPQNPRPELGYMRQLMLAINRLVDGRSNNVGEVTLEANEDSTIVKNALAHPASVATLSACTPDAALDVSSGMLYIEYSDGFFTIFHDNVPDTDRIFRYVLVG